MHSGPLSTPPGSLLDARDVLRLCDAAMKQAERLRWLGYRDSVEEAESIESAVERIRAACYEPCEACRGTGEWSDGHRCPSCHGTGEVVLRPAKCSHCQRQMSPAEVVDFGSTCLCRNMADCDRAHEASNA